MIWVKLKDSPIRINVDVRMEDTVLGCHAKVINNVCMYTTVQWPWGAAASAGPGFEKWKLGVQAYSLDLSLAQARTFEELKTLLPECLFSGYLSFSLLDEQSQQLVCETLYHRVATRGTVIFAAVVNYGKESRDSKIDQYFTCHLIKHLMENRGGDWYGLPVMQNVSMGHGREYGHMALHQVVVWRPPNEHLHGPVYADTRFELHPKGEGKYGTLVKMNQAKKDFEKISNREALAAATHDLRGHAEKLLSKMG